MANPKEHIATKKQTGLAIVRNDNKFTLTWKFGDKDYGAGQVFKYAINTGKWNNHVNVGKTAKSKSFSLTKSDYYPSTNKKLDRIVTCLQGTRKKYTATVKRDKKNVSVDFTPEQSPEATKDFFFYKPPTPSVSFALGSNYYTSVLNVNTKGNTTDHYWIRQTCYQTAFYAECYDAEGKDVPKSKWGSTQKPNHSEASYSLAKTESTGTLASGSHTRWFKVWTQGVAGDSPFVYVKHVYAAPKVAKNVKAKVTKQSSGYMCRVDWELQESVAYPVDQTIVQYVIATIDSTLSGWNNASEAAGTNHNGSLTFPIDALIEDDKALYVRVNTKHDNNITYGAAVRVPDGIGPLTAPTQLNVSKDDATYKATVTATNNSAVATAFLVVKYMPASNPKGWDIGVIEPGSSSVIVQCPNWSNESGVKFSVRAVYGSKTATTRADGVGSYAVSAITQSAEVSDGGSIPSAPGSVSAKAADISGTIRVEWNWSWSAATLAEISWADHYDAWESTDEPSTYQVESMHASQWNISGLETGIVWYIRVRLGYKSGDAITWGPYGVTDPVDLSSAPIAPVIDVSAGAIAEDGDLTVTWTYSTGDGTGQAAAQIALVTTVNNQTVYTPFKSTQTAQSITFNAADDDVQWSTGQSYTLAVNVTSESGHTSEWSDPVTVFVVEPLTAVISSTSLVPETITEDGVTRDIYSLKSMPFTATITGAGNAGTTTLAIERRADYQIDRPDESQLTGYDGETIVLFSQIGEAEITIDRDDLIGRLDDEALYRLVCTVSDSFGQSSTVMRDFEVHWTAQALMPVATVQIDATEMMAKITPTAPSGAAVGDSVDIYRLSVDKPVLIYEGAAFGTTYVDPFPTLGQYGGHRVVYRTLDGDYITADGHLAWLDVNETLESDYNIIDFGTGRVMLQYNIDLGSSWSKDFKETQYLGGSVQGDWNPAVSRTATIAGTVIATEDPDTIEAMRRLAVYPGICHIRTKDGSSYSADVQVSEDMKQAGAHKIVNFSLKITRVDPEELDGMTLAEWNALHDED